MKLKSILLASAVLAGLPSLASAEPDNSWSLAVGAGGNWLDDVNGTIAVGAGAPFELGFDTGWVAEVGVGYNWEMVRLELELSYRENDADFFNSSFVTVNGDDTQFAQMVNLIWDLPLGDTIELSLGGGIGGVLVDVGVSGSTIPGETVFIDGDDYVFAYQAIAGLSVDVGDHTELFAEYHYFATEDADIGGFTQPGHAPFSTEDFDMTKHSALVGLRFFFGEEVAPFEEAAPPPAPPPPQTSFAVDFDFNKANLTASGQSAVAEAAEASKNGASPVTLDLHGDGDAARDAELSDRRGAAVKAALVDLGVPPDKISVETRDGGDALVTIE